MVDGGPGFGGITITRRIDPRTGQVTREAGVVSGSRALRRRLRAIEGEREPERQQIVLREGEKEFTGTLDPGTGQILGVRTVSVVEQRRRESLSRGFVSIDPRTAEPGIRPVETISQQLALRRAIPVLARDIPLQQPVQIQRRDVPRPIGEVRVAPTPTPIGRVIQTGERLQQVAGRERVVGRTVRAFGFEAVGQTTQAAGEFAESFVETIKRPETALLVGGTLLLTRSPQLARVVQVGLTAALPFIGAEKLRQIGRGEETFAGAAGEFGAFAVAFKAGELAFEVPGLVRGKVREARLQRGITALERGAMLEEPFRVLPTETQQLGQFDLFGRPVPKVKVRRAIRELDINKVAFGIERNPLRPVPEGILPTGQRRLAEDVLFGVSRITGEARPVRVVERQPFIFEPRVGRFVEFVPQGEFGLVTVSPQVQARARIDIFDTSIQTRLVEPAPPSRIFRRLPPPERLPAPRVTQPRRFGRGVDTVTIRTTTSQDLLFTGRPVQETFLTAPEPLPVIPRVRRLNLLLSPLRISDVSTRRERVSTLDALNLSLIPGEAFRLDVRPEQRVDIFQELVPRTLPREALDIGLIQVQDVGQITIPDIPTAPLPPPLVPGFDITQPPRQAPIPPRAPPLLLGLPRERQRGRRREALLDPFKQPKEFVPSVAAFTFRVFGEPREEQVFGGFEFRPIPKRLRGLL